MVTTTKRQHKFTCIACNTRFDTSKRFSCPRCGELVEITYDLHSRRRVFITSLKKPPPYSVWRYRELLPIADTHPISIGEGGTSLTKSNRLARKLGLSKLYFKNEGQNPTASFKDRGMTVVITRAIELGARTVLCASTGNTSASMAAYAARAGLNALVLIPSGKIAKGKLVQAIIHGAKIVKVSGNFDAALKKARQMAERRNDLYLVNSLNPYRIEGQKTISFEVWEQLEKRVPDAVFVPVGNAGNISAIWKGFRELKDLNLINRTPRMIGVQAAGAAPLATAYAKGEDRIVPWEHPETWASAIRIGAPASWRKALKAVQESNGSILSATDNEIRRAQRLLADHEGIFGEPASATAIAGLIKARRTGLIQGHDAIICVITGHGLKDQSVI
ncbi:MAG TPA: threonine synthase [Candidatus Bathyarchaeia archaeon]|nr:threonine synthase [Candidatus Bathyarchaeia archaeon]